MGETSPTAIFTDQCESIKAAIHEVMPNTVHRCRDLKNVLKAHFKVYLDWDNDIAVPSIPDTDSDSDEIFIRNLREVCTRGRPQINTNKSSCQNAFCRDGRRWGSKYYDVYNKGQSSQGRSGDGRRGRRESR
ncbi:hypothetical protein T459_19639 [Capsicum annuum]|uniref:Uncharacterized protein n=1 Tax=Capsicum annuum TaxID=4072 RepID=A0A2G2Z278_CAPAN|nr:hypothetical protein T459_19639 [Capsicum annuum]